MAQDVDGALQSRKNRFTGLISPMRAARMLPGMPIYVQFDPIRVAVSFERDGEDVLFRFRDADVGQGFFENLIDAYRLREAFLDIKTPEEALDLLSIAGHFVHLRGEGEDQLQETFRWSDFQKWQELIRQLLTKGRLDIETLEESATHKTIRFALPEHLSSLTNGISQVERGWLHGYPDQIVIRSDSPYLDRVSQRQKRKTLFAEIMVDSTLEAILATVYIDHLSGVDYQLCALVDCHNLYELSSKHQRQYCSQACAHKASVRRRRAEAKAAKQAAKNKAAKSRSKKGKV